MVMVDGELELDVLAQYLVGVWYVESVGGWWLVVGVGSR